jgi:ribonuclease HII
VVAAAVILDVGKPISGLADSKTLTPERREILAASIKRRALDWGLGRVGVEDIDEMNILQASLLAMRRAVEAMSVVADLVLVDGSHAPPMVSNVLTVRKGDAKVAAIAAASMRRCERWIAIFPATVFRVTKDIRRRCICWH